ncbi:hypothetical protein Hypma_013961 [Hypsizygus marmoreus]|uniref:Uncharacterized protein n=1 Tax=Hypsizygus marmoreus TaxID=39966 RepID=A0A369K749_HYPMA|nr:hypothetical protein Hypma_013961 [Hypsizygus marmoreus]
MAPNMRLDTPTRMAAGFAGVLLLFGATFIVAKRNIAGKRRLDLEEYRASQAVARTENSRNGGPGPKN